MKRVAILPALLAAALALMAWSGGAAQGQGPVDFPGTDAELDAYTLLGQEKMLTARTRADALLRESPDSFVGHYVLGTVLREAEGSLPRALTHLREAQRLFEAKIGGGAGSEAARRLHRDILLGIADTAGLMEQYAYVLEILDYHDSLYEPHLLGQRAWPLMKLHRYDEARAFAQRAIDTKMAWQTTLGMNGLCAIESEAHDRKGAYDRCLASLERAKQRGAASASNDPAKFPRIAVHAHNAALAALSILRHDEAERLALDGTHHIESSVSNPWRLLTQLYLAEGRPGDAVSAIRHMQEWCAHQPPGTRDQKGAETDAATATLLLAAGEADAALRFISRALERPDRQGLSSAEPEQATGGHAVIRHAIRRVAAELEAERASTLGTLSRAGGVLASAAVRAAALPDVERVINVLSDDGRLDATLRIYLDGGLEDLPPWLLGDLVDILGPGVVSVGLARARAQETLPEVTPYFDALEAEVALARGDDARALALAESTAERLPRGEALMRARVAAIGGEAARRAGDLARAVPLYQRSLEIDPGAIRRLGLAIPAAVRVDRGGEAAVHAATVLGRSPRLKTAEHAFEVHIGEGARTPDGTALRACLIGAFGASLACAEVAPAPGERAVDFGSRVAREFHHVVFAIRMPITDTDVRSLDGTTTMARDAGRERLRGILEGAPGAGGQ